ncbi:hypothetical protein [Bacteroides faecis]|jgi:hypothetical protein|uniref:hypothetical protein n=1 Tax=Bacteroides faecis TaxID=674529 RepID=UPI001C3F8F1D|nr:hypothetical protein [Bacteroides faecis]DAY34022.1 MAG TPA: Vpu protein [Caudoviricetes sp.]
MEQIIILVILIFILFFIICREILCRYWKINERIKNQQEIIRLLKKIANEDNMVELPSDNKLKKNSSNLFSSIKFMITGKY